MLAGRPLTGRFALSLALLAAALLAAGALRFGWSALLPAYCYLALVSVPLAVIDAVPPAAGPPDAALLPHRAGAASAALAVPRGGQHFLHALAAGRVRALLRRPVADQPGQHRPGRRQAVRPRPVPGLVWRPRRVALLGGFVLAAVVGVILIAAGRATRKTHIPFGPFMLAAALAVLLTPALSG
jgi:leader peptidase (prepilin peptidase)/N-methyltransferase